ncbi:MAG: hypothetical protein L6R35_000187 [Caloplaca aegaea]|nr:MAG: hypothetical protein L6R35_000187 [Caloplaca aegaea]
MAPEAHQKEAVLPCALRVEDQFVSPHSRVLSPLEAITTYENKNNISSGWINFAISRSAPNGFWQRLERGEIKMDEQFFKGFHADLRNEKLWKEYQTNFRNNKQKLKHVANPTQLGDHVSLKAEAANSTPTDQDRGAQTSGLPGQKAPEMRDEGNGRPQPTSSSSPSPPEATSTLDSLPPLPNIDGESLFWSMMAHARNPDPYIFPALLRLEKLPYKERPIIAALSNTTIFPPDHPYSRLEEAPENDPRSHFDVFVSSADVGLRKPDPKIYKLAVEKIDRFDKEHGGDGVKAEDCIFLDDIGENLKIARSLGMKTIKVILGKTWRAVKELEQGTGFDLMDDRTRRSKL